MGFPGIRVVLLVLGINSFLSGCGDYSVSLPGGYELTRVYAGTVLIHHPEKGVVVDANVDAYDVTDGFVIGHVSIADELPEKEFSKPGYFILNTKTHELKQGLDREGWVKSLKAVGKTIEPVLKSPSRYDGFFLRLR